MTIFDPNSHLRVAHKLNRSIIEHTFSFKILVHLSFKSNSNFNLIINFILLLTALLFFNHSHHKPPSLYL